MSPLSGKIGRRWRFARAFALSSLCAFTFAPAGMAMDIRNDMGGPVAERLVKVQRLDAQGTPVRILGNCISACTLYLGLRKTCVSPEARLGFHGPSSRLAGIPLPYEEFDRVSRQMAAHYPEAIRQWFLSEARFETDSYIVITGRQAIAMGARSC